MNFVVEVFNNYEGKDMEMIVRDFVDGIMWID